MSEMFGAPNGYLAADENARQNILGALKARGMEVELENAPLAREKLQADILLTQGQAGHQTALTALNQAQTAALVRKSFVNARLGEIQRGIVGQMAAGETRQRDESLLSQGITPTVENTRPPPSIADVLRQTITAGMKEGLDPQDLAGLYKELSAASAEEAKTKSELALTTQRNVDTRHKQFTQLASLAKGALEVPANYPAALAQMAAMPGSQVIVGNLTGNYVQDRGKLEVLAAAGMTLAEKAKAESDRLQAQASQARAAASQAQAGAAVEDARSRVAYRTKRLEYIDKNGARTDAATGLIRERTAATREQRLAKENLNYPIAPSNPTDYRVGQTYRNLAGQRAVAQEVPANTPGAAKNAAGKYFKLVPIQSTSASLEEIDRAFGED